MHYDKLMLGVSAGDAGDLVDWALRNVDEGSTIDDHASMCT